MIKVFMMMKRGNDEQQRYLNSRLYESQKKNFSKTQSICQHGENNSQYGKVWVSNITERYTYKVNRNIVNSILSDNIIKRRIVNFDKYFKLEQKVKDNEQKK